ATSTATSTPAPAAASTSAPAATASPACAHRPDGQGRALLRLHEQRLRLLLRRHLGRALLHERALPDPDALLAGLPLPDHVLDVGEHLDPARPDVRDPRHERRPPRQL